MNKYCYSLENLSKHLLDSPFIYEYESKVEITLTTYKYDIIIEEIKECLEIFRREKIKTYTGIALDVREHSARSCVLLLRCLLLGGELFPSPQEINSWLHETFPYGSKRIFNIYGITEYSCWATIHEYHQDNADRIPLGKSLDEVTLFQIENEETGKYQLRHACKGELSIGSCERYCLLPQFDQNVPYNKGEIIFRQTGDLVERDKEGNLYYIGRINNCIKRLGKRLCLDSLALKIEILLKMQNVCLWDKDANKLIICFCCYKSNTEIGKNISTKLQENLEDFEQPDEITYISKIPLNKHGKVDRRKLLSKFLEMKNLTQRTPLNIFETFLQEIFGFESSIDRRQTLISKAGNSKRMKQNLDASFIESGGTSFQALSLATEIGELLEKPEQQRQLLEMFLSAETSLTIILNFLDNVLLKRSINEENLQDCVKLTSNGYPYSIKLLWRSDLKKCVDASPKLFQNKYVIVGSHSHLMLTLDTTTGEEISRLELSDRIECPAFFHSSNLAVVGCYDGILYGFNFKTGIVLWEIKVSGMIKAKPLIIGNTIIFGSYGDDYNIHAFQLETQKCLWRIKLGSKGIFSSPLKVFDNFVLFCTLDGSYALINSYNGSFLWKKKLESPIFSSPAIIENTLDELIIAEVNGKIHICKAESGEKITNFHADGNIFSGITTIDQKQSSHNILILFGCHDGHVYCLEYDFTQKHINLNWKISLSSPVYSTPVIVFNESTIVACSTKGLIVLIDIIKAEIKGSYNLEAEIFSTPSVDDQNRIFLGARDNYLYAFQMSH
ncbi:aminoadipate-semialdehyde dehydrogenase isoform X2 [Haematobia irritans]|uniref:aminoadipate-semialdehyde dehydrogenase isoform X2 n=1 Tax=Haematobia irritans TaxID=7368 RepID=UPI003F5029B2